MTTQRKAPDRASSRGRACAGAARTSIGSANSHTIYRILFSLDPTDPAFCETCTSRVGLKQNGGARATGLSRNGKALCFAQTKRKRAEINFL